MRINISVELRRPARRSVALVLGALLLVTPAVVLASHQFPDVPNTNPFHDQISVIAKAGITGGFSDGTYRPSDPVTRQAMAAFLSRTGGRVALAAGGAPMTPSLTVFETLYESYGFVPVRQVTITVPGVDNDAIPNQLVYLTGRVQLRTSMSTSTKGCPCQFLVRIRDVATNDYTAYKSQTFESGDDGNWIYGLAVEELFLAPPGTRTYELQAYVLRDSASNTATFDLSSESSLSAMTFPFGSTGGNTP